MPLVQPQPPPVSLDDYLNLDLFTPDRDSSLAGDSSISDSFLDFFDNKPSAFSSSFALNDLLFPSYSSSAPSPPSDSQSMTPSFAIDPALMASPAFRMPSTSPEDFDQDDQTHTSEHGSDDDDDFAVIPVKVAGKGKAGLRKGTVASGGVLKKAPGVSTAAVKDTDDPDDWRPTPEEYKRMNSKEKRQLRNKISARNFRVRRKEYITTLEGDVAERDNLIDVIRQELGATKLENVALRKELEQLKQAMLLGQIPPLPPPAPLESLPSPVSPAATTPKRATRSSLAKPNTQKDLPAMSPRSSSSRAFWGGSATNFGGVTSVHTTLVPDWFAPGSLLVDSSGSGEDDSGSGSASPHSSPHSPHSSSDESVPSPVSIHIDEPVHIVVPQPQPRPRLQENLNPLMNLNYAPPKPASNPSPVTGSSTSAILDATTMPLFDSFATVHPLTFTAMDAYRMHLWRQLARDNISRQPASGVPASNNGTALTGASIGQLFPQAGQPSNLLPPHWFASPTASSSSSAAPAEAGPSSSVSSLTAMLSKASLSPSTSAPATPPTSLPRPSSILTLSNKDWSSSAASRLLDSKITQQYNHQQQQQTALFAAMASHTLLSRMGSAFWDAFSHPSTSASSSSSSGTSPHLFRPIYVANPLSSTSTAAAQESPSQKAWNWDVEKVRKVLEGHAVVRVLDVDVPPAAASAGASMSPVMKAEEESLGNGLEESLRRMSLTSSRSWTSG